MSKILVLAPSGAGKSTSLRDLPPESTAILNCDIKELPLKGWRKKYQTVRDAAGKIDVPKSNYIETNKASNALLILKAWEAAPHIKNIAIDTLTHLITKEYMTSTIGKDFKAYQALGKTFYDIIDVVRDSKKNYIVMAHVEKKINDMGDIVWDMKSHGKMILDLVPASYFTTVLLGEVIKKDKGAGAEGNFRYVFRTQTEGNDPAKSPAWVETDSGGETIVKTALEFYEDNNIADIFEKLELFESAV